MKIGAEIEWRKDEFGHKASALFLGGLCCGCIQMHPEWKKFGWPGPYRGWFMNDESGNETGTFKSAEDARSSVEKKLFDAIQIQRFR